MEVANPCLQQSGWREWKRGVEVRRRRSLRERVMRWAAAEAGAAAEEEGEEEEEGGEENSEEEEEQEGVLGRKSGRELQLGEEDYEEDEGGEQVEQEQQVDEAEEEGDGHRAEVQEEASDEEEEEHPEAEEHPEPEQAEQLEEQLEEQLQEQHEELLSRSQDVQQHQASMVLEQEREIFPVPAQTDDEESNQGGGGEGPSCDSEHLVQQSPRETSQGCENITRRPWSSKERPKWNDESAASWTSYEEDEEEAEEEEVEHEDVADDGEVKIYAADSHPAQIFQTLQDFRERSLLTDLTLSTEDGRSVHAHSPVLAAVSALIRACLSSSRGRHGDRDENACMHARSMALGPEVELDGLEAVLEFAYSGRVSCLDGDRVGRVRAAARSLDVPRVLELCSRQEEQGTSSEGGDKSTSSEGGDESTSSEGGDESTSSEGGDKSTSSEGGDESTDEDVSAAEELAVSLQSIQQLWADGLGCDVILEVRGAELHVHRVVLAASSDYFRAMFCSGMRESRQSRIGLPFLLASDLEALVGSSYRGTLALSWSSVFEVCSSALQLQHQPALAMCLRYLQQEMDPESCLDVVAFAEAYELTQLLEVAHDFVLRQFQKVASTAKFTDLPAKQLLKYLNSSSLCVPSELVVFKAVVAWLQAKPRIRLRLANEMMRTIHFPLMTFKEFKEVQSLSMWSDDRLKELYEAILEEFCSDQIVQESQCRVYLPKESLVLTGGDQISEDMDTRSISKELWFGNSLMNHTGIKKAMEWRRLGEMPEPPRFAHEVAVLEGRLYVLGGKKYYGTGDGLASMYRYDPVENSWERLADMAQTRDSFSVIVLDGNIYAIGGHCDLHHMDSVERYSPPENSWSFARPLDLPLSGHVAKVLQGRTFISGGRNSDYTCLSSMIEYRPQTGSSYLSNMSRPRSRHCMEALGERLYVAGGVTVDDSGYTADLLACEVYSPAADCWTALAPLLVPHVGAGSGVLEGKLYVLGGYSQVDYSETRTAHRYDPALQRWENMGTMPGPNNDIRAALLRLPAELRGAASV